MSLWDELKSRLRGEEKPEHLRRGELGEAAAKGRCIDLASAAQPEKR